MNDEACFCKSTRQDVQKNETDPFQIDISTSLYMSFACISQINCDEVYTTSSVHMQFKQMTHPLFYQFLEAYHANLDMTIFMQFVSISRKSLPRQKKNRRRPPP